MVTLLIDPGFGSTESTGATARITLSFYEVGADDWADVLIENTTPPAIGSKVTAVGFEVPDSIPLSIAFAPGGQGSFFDTLTFDDSVSPGWINAPGGYDVMITSDGNFEGGNPNGAPVAGGTETVKLSLGDTGLSPTALATTFLDVYTDPSGYVAIGRFQSVGPGGNLSDKVGGGVPEPHTASLLVLGALALLRRRRANTA